jgi:hypothetical protein
MEGWFVMIKGILAGCGGVTMLGTVISVGVALEGAHAVTSAVNDNGATTGQAARVLLDQAGSGTASTAQFSTGGSDWTLTWSYDCSKFGYAGNFTVEPAATNNNPLIAGTDQPVNQLGTQGSGVEHYHAGGTLYLKVNSECDWHVTVNG